MYLLVASHDISLASLPVPKHWEKGLASQAFCPSRSIPPAPVQSRSGKISQAPKDGSSRGYETAVARTKMATKVNPHVDSASSPPPTTHPHPYKLYAKSLPKNPGIHIVFLPSRQRPTDRDRGTASSSSRAGRRPSSKMRTRRPSRSPQTSSSRLSTIGGTSRC
jgi:hypothetical protein